jgi:hypothetical protein
LYVPYANNPHTSKPNRRINTCRPLCFMWIIDHKTRKPQQIPAQSPNTTRQNFKAV